MLQTKDGEFRRMILEKMGQREFSIFEKDFDRRQRLKRLRRTMLTGGDHRGSGREDSLPRDGLVIERRLSLPVTCQHLEYDEPFAGLHGSPFSKAKFTQPHKDSGSYIPEYSEVDSVHEFDRPHLSLGFKPVSETQIIVNKGGITVKKEDKKKNKIEVLQAQVAAAEAVP